MNAAYAAMFTGIFPTRTTVQPVPHPPAPPPKTANPLAPAIPLPPHRPVH